MKTKILHLTLTREWFDQIATGKKRFEYREIKLYWKTRIEGKQYDEIHFRNGYGKKLPFMRVEYLGWTKLLFRNIYELALGEILEIKYWKGSKA